MISIVSDSVYLFGILLKCRLFDFSNLKFDTFLAKDRKFSGILKLLFIITLTFLLFNKCFGFIQTFKTFFDLFKIILLKN